MYDSQKKLTCVTPHTIYHKITVLGGGLSEKYLHIISLSTDITEILAAEGVVYFTGEPAICERHNTKLRARTRLRSVALGRNEPVLFHLRPEDQSVTGVIADVSTDAFRRLSPRTRQIEQDIGIIG